MTYYAGRDLANGFRTVRKNTIQIAEEIPEDQYGFRATAHTRTVAEMLAHIAALTGWQQQMHGVDKKTVVSREDFGGYTGGAGKFGATLTTKPDILRALQSEGDRFAAFLESLPEATLAELVSFPPPLEVSTKSRFEMLLGVKEHEMHHRGQLMLMQRMLGLVPHLTRRRQQAS